MLKNYFVIAWRNILKYRFYSLVNIIGLSAGIAFTMLIGIYVWSELQVNTRLKNADRQYILQSKWKDPNQGIEWTTMGPLAKALKEQYPDLVANYYRWDGITSIVSKGDKHFREGIQVCDSTMLNMYGFTLLHGDARTAFQGPYSVVITTDRAIKYFGKTDVVGQTIAIQSFAGSNHDFVVTGVLNKPAKNSITFITDDNDNQVYIFSDNISFFGRNMNWNNQYIVGYIELQKNVKPSDLDKPMQYLLQQNAPAQVSSNMKPFLLPVRDYYLSSNNGPVRKMLYTLSAIAFFILLMAVINFINMSVSRSATRMREIGIRKVLGGVKKQLILQFLTESMLLVLLATIVAIAIYVPGRNLFSNTLGKDIPSFSSFPLYFAAIPVLLVLTVGFIAGVYPAFVLSALKSVESLKGKLNAAKENILLRKSLVTFQFGIATIVFICAILISKQVNLFFSKDLGFDRDYIVSAQVPRNWTPDGVRNMETLRTRFSAMPEVRQVSLSFQAPDGGGPGNVAMYKAGGDSTAAVASQLMYTDEHYASTYNIAMAAGVFYAAPGTAIDPTKMVINETQAKALGWDHVQDAVGKQVSFQNFGGTYTIAGVVKDFHFGSMQQSIQPVTFMQVKLTNVFRVFSFKLKAGDIGHSIEALQKKWSSLLPGTPFDYSFMDDTLAKIYKSELQLKQASYIATALSFIIVLLGILGLVALSIQKRTKEIAIRKVLGSSVGNIVGLFMKDFLSISLVAGLIACPVAYIIMQKWLGDYAYKVNITASPFIIAIAVLVFITSLLIMMQTIKTALSKPVNNLRAD
jgi:putative ABC transport system permease protein